MRLGDIVNLPKGMDWLRQAWTMLMSVINGHLTFGKVGEVGNIQGVWATVVTPIVPDTDFTVTHNLGQVPVGYLLMSKSGACDVYTGSVASTSTTITLRASAADATVQLFIF